LERSGVGAERLRVGVDDDELDPFEAKVDHRVHGVAAGTAATDDLDPGVVPSVLFGELDGETHELLPGGAETGPFGRWAFALFTDAARGRLFPRTPSSELLWLFAKPHGLASYSNLELKHVTPINQSKLIVSTHRIRRSDDA